MSSDDLDKKKFDYLVSALGEKNARRLMDPTETLKLADDEFETIVQVTGVDRNWLEHFDRDNPIHAMYLRFLFLSVLFTQTLIEKAMLEDKFKILFSMFDNLNLRVTELEEKDNGSK